MANPRKPSNILRLTGAKRKNPGRYKGRGKTATDNRPVGRCPSFLTEPQKVAWKELVANSAPGVLLRSDRIAIELTVRLLVQVREGDHVTSATQAVLTSMLSKLGLTPASSTNVSIPAPETQNPFADV
ncbi:hypothetical protein N9H39_02025 [Gammaproteobacteria bacterium]|nr:hypothetical protein [Gammaproteobacteria bacterium]